VRARERENRLRDWRLACTASICALFWLLHEFACACRCDRWGVSGWDTGWLSSLLSRADSYSHLQLFKVPFYMWFTGVLDLKQTQSKYLYTNRHTSLILLI